MKELIRGEEVDRKEDEDEESLIHSQHLLNQAAGEEDGLTELEDSFYYQDAESVGDFEYDVLRRIPNKIRVSKKDKKRRLAEKGGFDPSKDKPEDWEDIYLEANGDDLKRLDTEALRQCGLGDLNVPLFKKKLRKMNPEQKAKALQFREKLLKSALASEEQKVVQSERLAPSGEWQDSCKVFKKIKDLIPLESKSDNPQIISPYDYFINCQNEGQDSLFAETTGTLKNFKPNLTPHSAFVLLEDNSSLSDK